MALKARVLVTSLLVILVILAWMIRLLLAQCAGCRVRREAMPTPIPAMDPECGCTRPWVIINPPKYMDPDAFGVQIEETVVETGISQAQWCETSIEDPSTGQTLRMVALGASSVIAAGGDETVRVVVAGLAEMGVRMGVIPVGTGNLLTQSLELPTDDVPAAMRVVPGNEYRLVDCRWLRVDGVEEPSSLPAEDMLTQATRTYLHMDEGIELPGPELLPLASKYSFVIIPSLGFDGKTMAETNSELKRHIGWVTCAIVVPDVMTTVRVGIHAILRRPRPSDDPVKDVPATPSSSEAATAPAIFEGEELSDAPEQEMAWIKSKSLMFANCGDLPYVTLAPGVRSNDSLLDMIAVDAQVGLLGQADLSWEILFQGFDLKTFNLANLTSQIRFRQTEGMPIRAHIPQTVQVDDNPVKTAMTMHVRTDQGALDVSVPKAL